MKKHMKKSNIFKKNFIIEGVDTSVVDYLFDNCGYHTLYKYIKRIYFTNDGCIMIVEEPIYKLLYYKFAIRRINKTFKKHYKISICKGLHFK